MSESSTELVITDKRFTEPERSEIVQAATPLGILEVAVRQNANPDTLAKLLDLQFKWEENEARKAFVKALADFKTNPPRLEKSKEVSFGQGKTAYKYTPLDAITSVVGPALAKHGLSYRWKPDVVDSRISVTCILQHVQGHSEQVTLTGEADSSGSKNKIQAVGSTVSYLERYTLLAITGLSTADQDTDGVTMQSASEYVESIQQANTIDELNRRSREAIKAGIEARDHKAVGVFMEARDRRERELAA